MKKAEIKVIRDILEEHRETDKLYFYGLFLLTSAGLILLAGTNVLYRMIVAGFAGWYGWTALKKTSIATELPKRKPKK